MELSHIFHPNELIMVDYDAVYFTQDNNGKKVRKPFTELICVLPKAEKEIILKYLQYGLECGAVLGKMTDEKTQLNITGNWTIYTDGTYSWTTKIIYHFREYDMMLPDKFLEHIKQQSEPARWKYLRSRLLSR